MDLTKFAERIREVRRDLNMNQEDFATMIKISRASLSFYETAARTPDIVTLRNLCEATGISAYYFLGMSDSKHDDNAGAVDALHLSENAVSKIKDDDVLRAVLNCLLENSDIDRIITLLATLREASKITFNAQHFGFLQEYIVDKSKREIGNLIFNAICVRSASDKLFTETPLINLEHEQTDATMSMLYSVLADSSPVAKAHAARHGSTPAKEET